MPLPPQIVRFWVTCGVKLICHYVMVKPDSHLKLLPVSILDIKKSLITLVCCWWAYGGSLKQLYPHYLGQILGCKFSFITPQDFLDPKNSLAWREHHDQMEFEFASQWGKLESSLFLYCQHYHCLHRCHGDLFRPFQVNILVLLPHHSRIILVALLGCVDLLRSVDCDRSPSFVLFQTVTTINFGRLCVEFKVHNWSWPEVMS